MKGGAGGIPGESREAYAVKELGPKDGKTGAILSGPNLSGKKKEFLVRALVIALAAVMVLGACLGVLSMTNKGHDKEKNVLVTPLFLTHSPILIESESALNSAHGVSGGSGTPSDPFVISGWNIDATASDIAGIAISNTTSSLVLRDVYVHSTSSATSGILLFNVSNCSVVGSLVTGNSVGIGASNCTHLAVMNNTVTGADTGGIGVMYSNHVLIEHNIAVDGAGIGVIDFSSVNLTIDNNTMSFNAITGLAMEFTDPTVISDTIVLDNIMDGNVVGITALSTTKSVIFYNIISDSTTAGLIMMGCDNNTVSYNIIANTSGGEGATLMSCEDNLFYNNNFVNNSASPQASDDSTRDAWNMAFPYPNSGNYWSDYSGSGPYTLGGMSGMQDNYPLANEVVIGNTPMAFFTVSPATSSAPAMLSFNASLCRDPDDDSSMLEVRWDFNSDGTWDTGWSTDKFAQHTYALAGSYNVTMEVRDPTGHTASMTVYIEVEPAAIPEFPGLVVPIVSMITILLVIEGLKRRR